MKNSTLLAIDPGTKTTGWGVFQSNRYVCSSVIKIKNKELDWLQRIDYIILRFLNLLKSYKIDTVVVEQPELFMSTHKGQAASNSGSILKVMALVFAIRTAAKMRGVKVVLISVRKWKGSVPKRITQMRIKRYLGIAVKDNNEADAIGIGLWYIRSK